MPTRRLVLQHAAFLVGLELAFGAARASEPASDAPLEPIVELNKRALLAYQMLDVAGAAELLSQALALCDQANLANHPLVARTLVHLGAVQVAGLKQPAEGIASFRRALAIDPTIYVTQSLQNPEVESAFEQAKTGHPAASSPVAESRSATPPAVPSRRWRRSINHPPVTRAVRGRPVTIKVQVPPGLAAFKVILAYRAEDSDEFLVRRMLPLKEAPGWFAAEIPLDATQGAHVAYYLEAQNLDDRPIATSGTPDLPHMVALTSEATAEDIPPAPANRSSTDQSAASTPGGLWLVLALGSGGGYHSGAPEMNPHDASTPPQAIHVSGSGMARLGHLAPEIGYFANDKLVISVQGRLQYVTGTQDVTLEHREYHAARLALAGLVKLSWLMRAPKRLRPFVTAQIGAGQIRHSITTPASANLTGCGGPTCKDTVVGGPGLAGVGGGLAFMLRSRFGLYAGLNVLASFPDFLVNADLNLGIVVLR